MHNRLCFYTYDLENKSHDYVIQDIDNWYSITTHYARHDIKKENVLLINEALEHKSIKELVSHYTNNKKFVLSKLGSNLHGMIKFTTSSWDLSSVVSICHNLLRKYFQKKSLPKYTDRI